MKVTFANGACRDAMLELGLACDGGKDSLSMAASAGGETVMAPGNLVVSAYVCCPDITLTVRSGSGAVWLVLTASQPVLCLGSMCSVIRSVASESQRCT